MQRLAWINCLHKRKELLTLLFLHSAKKIGRDLEGNPHDDLPRSHIAYLIAIAISPRAEGDSSPLISPRPVARVARRCVQWRFRPEGRGGVLDSTRAAKSRPFVMMEVTSDVVSSTHPSRKRWEAHPCGSVFPCGRFWWLCDG